MESRCPVEEMLRLGGKEGLNCVAEWDPAELEKIGTPGDQPLAGVPVLVKDNIDVKGLHTTAGSLALADNLAAADAPVVQALRRAGARIVGKTNMTEFANYVAHGMPGGYSSRGGQVLHAVDPALSPAGSSSGSAVAVAAGIVPMAVGTDTSFSVIACAMVNGICGLKPPVGVLPQEGIVPIAPTLDSAGPMGRTFSDTLRLYAAMREGPFPALQPADPAGLRLAVNRANEGSVAPGQGDFLRRLRARLQEEGASWTEVEQGPPPELVTIMQWEFKPALEAYLQKASAARKTLAEIVDYYENHPDTMMKYGDGLLRRALDETPGGLQGKPYLDALAARRETIARVREELAGLDAVVMTGPTYIMHYCGLPSVTVAARETDEHGVRRGVILYGADEWKLYRAALAIERVLRGE